MEVPESEVLPTVSRWAGLCFRLSCSPENLMHLHLYRSNQISYRRGCYTYTKRDSLTDFPLLKKTESGVKAVLKEMAT